MKFFDLHCDTASRIYYEKQSLLSNSLSVDIEKLIKGKSLGQVFAFFIDIGNHDDPYDEFLKIYNNFIEEYNKNKDKIKIINNYEDIIFSQEKILALLSIEEGEVLQGNIDNIKELYKLGIRIITLTWNYKNTIGYPNYNYIYKEKGLTEFGKNVVEEMEKQKIIVDSSHLSDAGFWDLINICKKPFIASHSNSRAIKEHPRNLSDEMIKNLSNKGGVMGLNFCADFLGFSKIATINDMILHIKHIRNVGGIDVIALGTDFDGIENSVEIKNISEMDKLSYELNKNGFTDDEIEKIFYSNVLRVFKDTL